MSHEIRTPLNAIVGFSTLISDAKTLSEAKENSKYLIDSANTLLYMVSNIIDIASLDVDDTFIKEEKYNLKEVINDIANLYKYKLAEKNLELKLNIKAPDVLEGDIDKIKRIIINLVDNAIKYTKKRKTQSKNNIAQKFIGLDGGFRGKGYYIYRWSMFRKSRTWWMGFYFNV